MFFPYRGFEEKLAEERKKGKVDIYIGGIDMGWIITGQIEKADILNNSREGADDYGDHWNDTGPEKL